VRYAVEDTRQTSYSIRESGENELQTSDNDELIRQDVMHRGQYGPSMGLSTYSRPMGHYGP